MNDRPWPSTLDSFPQFQQENVPKNVQAAEFLTKFPTGASEIAEHIKQNEMNDQKQISVFDQKSNEFKLIFFWKFEFLANISEAYRKFSKNFRKFCVIRYYRLWP